MHVDLTVKGRKPTAILRFSYVPHFKIIFPRNKNIDRTFKPLYQLNNPKGY